MSELWTRFAVEKREVSPEEVRPCILESWKRSRALGVDPYRSFGCVKVEPAELERKKLLRADLLEAAVPYLAELYRIIKGSRSLITLTDEDGVVLDVVSDEEIRGMKNFPHPGTVHSEKVIGTSGIGTTLAIDAPIQIRAEEHWLRDNHSWSCNSVPIHRCGKIIGCLNLSCPHDKSHEHSLGLVVASVNAIERELQLIASLTEKQCLIQQQNAVLELVDAGIILIDPQGTILTTNRMARDILRVDADMIGMPISEMIPAGIDFPALLKKGTALADQETVVRLKGKQVSLSISTALVRNGAAVDAMVIRVRESKAILRMVHRMTGSRAMYSFDDIQGTSPELLKCISLAKVASHTNLNSLILGESGTGKELFAHAIHNESNRRNGPFVAINCGALSRDLIQSELFGYEGGAFTGAKKEGNPGKLELADGGTLFLDEIGDLPLDAQVNLLRVLETGEVTRLGGKFTKSIDVRVIAATNKDIYRAVEEKVFRDDLFYRINTFVLKLPLLRERVQDIRTLAGTFLERFSRSLGRSFLGIREEVLEVFEEYEWPGNIRELANVLDRAIAVAESPWICLGDLPPSLQAPTLPRERRTGEQIREMEHERLAELIKETNGNLREVARRMGVARSTVYNKVRSLQIPVQLYRVQKLDMERDMSKTYRAPAEGFHQNPR
jgi:sigma-54 dependent transcriptional regulator, acetoin dehydrogenase operon transcriptional activator AcoR